MLRNVVGRTSRSGCPLGRVLQDPLSRAREQAGVDARRRPGGPPHD